MSDTEPLRRTDPMHALAERLGPRFFRLGTAALWTYACVLAPFGRFFKGTAGSLAGSVIFVAGCAMVFAAPAIIAVRQRISTTRMLELGFTSLALVTAILVGDVIVAVYGNWARAKTERYIASDVRIHDSTIWHGELYPRTYIPAGQSFVLYKPNVRLTGETYGERYIPAMLQSPTLVRSVLEKKHLSYYIGPEGLRELEPLSQSHIFALGDSFVLGFATDEGKIWPDLLGKAIGQPVYNMGVSATGPKPQLELLKYMLRTHHDTMHARQLLWMIFEGNDLENSYADTPAIAASASTSPSLFTGTLIEPFLSLPERVRSESIVNRFAHGELTLSARVPRYGQYEIDGVELPIPLFHSKRFGYRLFVPADMEAATKPLEYVLNHPHRPLLDQTFREMRDLSQASGFSVTVVIAPSDARVYGSAFDGFPALSAQPHFINYVARLAKEMGFTVIDLLPLLQPFARDEMLYYRDDHHWNERGNAVVAQLLTEALTRP